MQLSKNTYRLQWKGHRQIMCENTFEGIKDYIKKNIATGYCHLWEFEIFDNYGQLKTNIIMDDKADHTLTNNYFNLYK